MTNETDLKVIEHVFFSGVEFKLGCACKCFPLIGCQERFISGGECRSATGITEKNIQFTFNEVFANFRLWYTDLQIFSLFLYLFFFKKKNCGD